MLFSRIKNGLWGIALTPASKRHLFEFSDFFAILTFGKEIIHKPFRFQYVKANQLGSRRYPINGFTLIELLMTMAIIGILTVLALPLFKNQTIKARLSEVTNAISHVSSAAAAFYQENERWPNCNVDFTSIRDTLGVIVPRRYASAMTAQVTGGSFVISATITNISASNPTLNGDTLTMTADTTTDGSIRWIWGGNLDILHLPKQ